MHFWRTTVALATAVATLTVSLFTATAGAAPRSSPQAAHSAGRQLPAQAPTSEFFQGENAAEDPFDLQPGYYNIEVDATYDAQNDQQNPGECNFYAYLNVAGMSGAVDLSADGPITSFVSFNIQHIEDFGAGQDTLVVENFTTCSWSVTILPYQTGPASLSLLSVGIFLSHGGKLTPVSVVPPKQLVYFIATFSTTGVLPATLYGKVTIGVLAGTPHTFVLKGAKGSKAYWAGTFSAGRGGAAVATFVLTSGSLRVSRTLHFTVGSDAALGGPARA